MAEKGDVAREAYVTLAADDDYALGATVLGHSLRETGTKRDLVCLVTPEVSPMVRDQLGRVFHHLESVDVMNSMDISHLALLGRPELGVTLTKLHAWTLLQYEKVVFLDADTLVLQNIDDAFERDELSAAPDVGWPDCFNSGVFVLKPSLETFKGLLEMSKNQGSFDGGDQGLLNLYFSDWATADIRRHLPFTYNMHANATYFYRPAFKQYGRETKVVHFIGPRKPWHETRDSEGRVIGAGDNQSLDFLQLWWDVLDRHSQNIIVPRFVELIVTHPAMHGTSEAGPSDTEGSTGPVESGSDRIINRLTNLLGKAVELKTPLDDQESAAVATTIEKSTADAKVLAQPTE